eukprot:6421853-Alexandrium_andersonii.AAC.1
MSFSAVLKTLPRPPLPLPLPPRPPSDDAALPPLEPSAQVIANGPLFLPLPPLEPLPPLPLLSPPMPIEPLSHKAPPIARTSKPCT